MTTNAPSVDRARAATFDPARAEGAGLSDSIRNLRTALFLGWRVEANWTDPLLFVIYTVVKPIASLLLLVVMIEIIGAGGTGSRGKHVRAVVGPRAPFLGVVVSGIGGAARGGLGGRRGHPMLKELDVSPAA